MHIFQTAAMDSTARWITNFWLFTVISFAVLAVVLKESFYTSVCAILILVSILMFIFTSRDYRINSNEIVINCIAKKTRINLHDIIQIEQTDKSYFKIFDLLWSCGVFGYYGWWKNTDGLTVNVYLKRRDNIVLLKTSAKIYAITPKEPQRFISLLQGMIKEKNNSSF